LLVEQLGHFVQISRIGVELADLVASAESESEYGVSTDEFELLLMRTFPAAD
jgi:hypothetical protein